MKSQMELRLECLKLATSLGASKNIAAKDVIPTAMEFFRWIDNNPDDKPDLDKLRTKFGTHVEHRDW